MSGNSVARRPHYFRCTNCRRNRPRVHDRRAEGWKGFVGAARLTGRTRWRNAALSREYRCTDCGHTGWSSHVDLARALPLTLAFRAGKRPTVKNPNFGAQYGGHIYPMPVESTFGTDAVFPATHQGPDSEFTRKQPANKRPRGKRK